MISDSEGEDTRRTPQQASCAALGPWDGPGGTSILDRVVLGASVWVGDDGEAIAELTGLSLSLVELVLVDLRANGRLESIWAPSQLEAQAAERLVYRQAVEAGTTCPTCGAPPGATCLSSGGLVTLHPKRTQCYERKAKNRAA